MLIYSSLKLKINALVPFVAHLLCNMLYNKSTTGPQQIKQVEFKLDSTTPPIAFGVERSKVQWRSQYGANGATAPPGPHRTTYVIRANPMRYSGGEGGGGVAVCVVKPVATIMDSQLTVCCCVSHLRES